MGPDTEIAALVTTLTAALADRAEELADGMARQIQAEIPFYGAGLLVDTDELCASCAGNVAFMLGSLGNPGFDVAVARSTGARRAEQGAPLPEVMAAYRVGSRYLWDAIVAAAALPPEALVRVASRLWDVQAVYTDAMASSYRDVVARQLLAQDQERSALVEAVLDGGITDGATLWETTDLLRLPHQGPYVVVAAEVPEVGRQALPDVEARLRALDLASAWRLLPDLQAGVVCPRGRLDRLVSFLRSAAVGRVGVSPGYEELGRTRDALRLARIAMRGSVDGSWVTVFDEAPLTVAAVADPDVMERYVRNVFGGLDDLTRDDRAILLDTLEAWLDSGGSAGDTAARLYCHPNTVRHRLRRIEERTGRSLSSPRGVSELCLALEAYRRA